MIESNSTLCSNPRERHLKEKQSKPFKPSATHSYSNKEIEEIENQVLQEPRRGSEPFLG